MVEVECVARGVEKDRLVADTAIEGFGDELDALRFEGLPGCADVVDLERDGHRVRPELLPDAVGSMIASVRLPAWYSVAGMSP